VRLPDSLPAIEDADFVLQKMIGMGGSGKVYRALSNLDGQHYALKFLHKAFVTRRSAVRRFLDECALLAGLNHPHIMPVVGCGRTRAGICFFAMNLARGDLQGQTGRRPVKQIVSWLMQAAAGVQFAHDHGIVHCDLKPSNLLVSAAGTLLVSDFGLARKTDDLAASRMLAGTPAFMAPEQVSPAWGRISPRTDVWGLGATLYTLLTGRPPFVANRPSEVLTQLVSPTAVAPPRTLRRTLPAWLNDICVRCLEKHPEARVASVEALLDELRKNSGAS
jgi:serine/threonine protein kinase